MKMEAKFYQCEHCGNIITFLEASGVIPVCCGDKMVEIKPNTKEAATEKHIPEVTIKGDQVTAVVGSVIHPMIEEHYIQWIYLETDKGLHVRHLEPGEKPEAVFVLNDEKPVAVYEYCNIHGLWKKDL